jgi:hypothetical protein
VYEMIFPFDPWDVGGGLLGSKDPEMSGRHPGCVDGKSEGQPA